MEQNVSKQLVALLEQVDKSDLIAFLKQSADRGVVVDPSVDGGEIVNDGEVVVQPVVVEDGVVRADSDVGSRGVVRTGSDTESQGSTSWSDIMDEVEDMERKAVGANSAVVMPQYTYCEAVKKVNFISPEVAPEPGFQAAYVRSPANRALIAALAVVGVKVPKACHAEIALARHTAGVLPSAFVGGRERLKALALVGDKAMALVMIDSGYGNGRTAATLQGDAASLLSVARLSRVFVNSGWSRHVSLPPGVDPRESKPAGEACEAICGAIYHGCGLAGVAKFMAALQLL